MSERPLISVIVPCYQVEKWLPECLDSLLDQSYTNLELLCVNDGSSDRTGEILEAYRRRDPRIRVITQENKGLSGARNAALELASGEYIAFLDADDMARRDWLGSMLSKAEDTHSDIAICSYREYFEDSGRYTPLLFDGVPSFTVFPPREALCRLIGTKPFKEFVWNKLYRRALWEGIRFPLGRNFEDVAVMYRVFGRSKGAVALADTFIDYRQRSSSIIGARSVKNELDGIENYIERFRTLGAGDPTLLPLLTASFVRSPLRHLALVSLWNAPGKHRAEATRYRELTAFLKEQRGSMLSLSAWYDKLLIRLMEKGSIPCLYLAGAVAFGVRLMEKLGLKKVYAVTDEELREAVYGK